MRMMFPVLLLALAGAPVEIPPYVWPAERLILDPTVPKGGSLQLAISGEPANVNPVTGKDTYGSTVNSWILETLLGRDSDTYATRPGLADRWMVEDLPNGRQAFTFHINRKAHFSDGHPVTAEDVVYSFEVFFDDDIPNHHVRSSYWHLEGVEALDSHTVRFTTKDRYYKNFIVAAGLEILPKHIYEPFFRAVYREKRDIDTVELNLNLTTIGSGSYKLYEWTKGKTIIFQRDPSYWGWGEPQRQGAGNFDWIVEKIIRDDKIQYEYFKKQETDYYAFTPRQWVKEADLPAFDDGTLVRLEIQDWKLPPSNYSYIGWNNVDPHRSNLKEMEFVPHKLFGDPRVRLAMTHLVDRETYCRKIAYGYAEPVTGPFGTDSPNTDPEIRPWPFDLARALELLREAGWEDTDDDGVLNREIDGEQIDFEFTLLIPQGIPETVAFMTIVQSDMKKAGVQMQIRQVEWNSFQKLTDDKSFDAMSMAWYGGILYPDPIPVWHSASARPGGYNMIGYSNPEVDRLSQEAVAEMDPEKRAQLFRRIHRILHQEQPYTFLTSPQGSLLAHNGRIRKQRSNLTGKEYFQYYVGYAYWYIPAELQRKAPR